MSVKVSIRTNNVDEVKAAMKNAAERALLAIGENAVTHSQEYITQEHRIDTGRMRESMTHTEDENSTYIGTNVEYAVYQELGTSTGIKPAHFISRAATNHSEEYRNLIIESVKNA